MKAFFCTVLTDYIGEFDKYETAIGPILLDGHTRGRETLPFWRVQKTLVQHDNV